MLVLRRVEKARSFVALEDMAAVDSQLLRVYNLSFDLLVSARGGLLAPKVGDGQVHRPFVSVRISLP